MLHDNKRLTKKNTELETSAEAAADVMREKEKLNSRIEELVKVNFNVRTLFDKRTISYVAIDLIKIFPY